MNLRFCAATPNDRDALLALAKTVDEARIYPTLDRAGQQMLARHRRQDIDLLFDTGRYCTLKASCDGDIVGYIAWRDGYYISHLYVANDFQRRGIGALLLDQMRKQATRFPLHLRSSLNAVGFYQRYGFRLTSPPRQIKGVRFVTMKFQP